MTPDIQTGYETKVLPCDCTSPWQDKKYGKGKRVHNPKQGKGQSGYNCTVCSKSKSGDGKPAEPVKA